MILCDLFPLYDFPTDACAPAKEPIQHGNSDVGNGTSTKNTSTQSNYGFQKHSRPSTAEFVLVTWVFTLFCEEVRQVIDPVLLFLMHHSCLLAFCHRSTINTQRTYCLF